MDFEDLLEPEVAVGAAIAAALFSPRVRGLLRKGAVYGLAGALMAGDAVATAARNVGETVRQTSNGAAARASQSAEGTTTETTPGNESAER
jgi:hypothetical protein